MVLNDSDAGRPSKRARGRITADRLDVLSFSTDHNLHSPVDPFHKKVGAFLSRFGRLSFPPSVLSSVVVWELISSIGDSSVVLLRVVEEDVTRSSSVYCDQCRVVGWSGHPVCRKRYHFILRAEDDPSTSTNHVDESRPCPRCGNPLHPAESSRCKWCNIMITADDMEEWVRSQLEDNGHLLHGVIHSNGFGHLLTLNGRAGGSRVLSGRDIMNFWDGLCAALSVRKVSVMDVSKKHGMEYRLLHAITHRHSWYGEWGYDFSSGSYALTLHTYRKAVHTLSNIPLAPLLFHGRKPKTYLQTLISFYMSVSPTQLFNLHDLFSYMLTLIPHSPCRPSPCNVLCAWTMDDVLRVDSALIRVLEAAGAHSHWVARNSLKGALGGSASSELLDYCIRHLPGISAPNGMVVQARFSPGANALDFRLHPPDGQPCQVEDILTRDNVIRDLKFLYDSLVHPETMMNHATPAMRECIRDSAVKLLDCKQFMKDYLNEEKAIERPGSIQIWCHLELSNQAKGEPFLPPELVVLPLNATVGDLKLEVTRTFQDIYPIFKRFRAEGLPEYGGIGDCFSLKLLTGLTGNVRVRGKCISKHGLNRFRMERGVETWTVDCVCGTKDDDGERMLACDTCGVWQHTRCAGIDNSDSVPMKFVCNRCANSTLQAVNPGEASTLPLPGGNCRVGAMAVASGQVMDNNVNVTFGVK
ncbi:hypothetical protein MLD38_033641 [Melastoma candidum]|uniref:Uncharacterized protein n=1 Tax=Melastoma candidum TaxID=119954 RepID=A0ACB9M8R7_9MYRT|nr:hypothetical protein MLD38_033641 [Melastoma candidum]